MLRKLKFEVQAPVPVVVEILPDRIESSPAISKCGNKVIVGKLLIYSQIIIYIVYYTRLKFYTKTSAL